MILRVYFVSCLGHLFRRARIFLSILFYYLIGILMQVTAVISMVSVTTGRELPFITWFTRLSYNGTMCVFFGGLLLINAAIGCIYFFVSEAILRKRLNLD